MIKFKKEAKSRESYMDYISAPLPADPEPLPSFGRDVNIINIVEEHGPKRIQQIEQEIVKLEEKRTKLLREQEVLTRLVTAVQPF